MSLAWSDGGSSQCDKEEESDLNEEDALLRSCLKEEFGSVVQIEQVMWRQKSHIE